MLIFKQSFKKILITLGLLFAFLNCVSAQEFLDPSQAFKLQVQKNANQQMELTWEIAAGYKLYKESMSAKAVNASAELPLMKLPAGKSGFDELLGKVVSTYQSKVSATIEASAFTKPFELEVTYQGCAVAGLCYPPQTQRFAFDPDKVGSMAVVASPTEEAVAPAASKTLPEQDGSDEASSIQGVLRGGNLLKIAGAFLVFGLLLSFTPCVLPMIPILSSIIVGQQGISNRRQTFMLAVSYSLGMAMVYTILGVAAGMIGEGLAAFMQKPWVLLLFALMLAGMALSMFDVYQLQLPARLQGALTEQSSRFKGGRHLSVFFMGALSSLIVGPCVAGPLAGALLYISQTGDIFIGGFALFAMACGMSAPLLLTGLSAGSLLPRAGSWMNHVKSAFGFMLLGVSLWMINPLMSDSARLFAWGALLVFLSVFTPIFSSMQSHEPFGRRVARAFGILVLLTGLAQFSGALMGNSDLLKPLKSQGSAKVDVAQHVQFERIKSLADLEEILRTSNRPVMLDFYADWCVACLEMEKFTFIDPQVISQMKSWRLLQVDVTQNTPLDRELMKKFDLFGPPAMVFFDPQGQEIKASRVIGFMAAKPFEQHLDRVLNSKR